jgi:hypothetical protein
MEWAGKRSGFPSPEGKIAARFEWVFRFGLAEFAGMRQPSLVLLRRDPRAGLVFGLTKEFNLWK